MLYKVLFLVYSKVNKLYINIHPLFSGFHSHLGTPESIE